jgi:hypothetical protein
MLSSGRVALAGCGLICSPDSGGLVKTGKTEHKSPKNLLCRTKRKDWQILLTLPRKQ